MFRIDELNHLAKRFLLRHLKKLEFPIVPATINQADRFPSAWLVWGLAFLFIFAGLGGPAILDNNEGLYAEIPREMLAAHDWRLWIIPHLNGLPYMEKPPLLYWLSALSFTLFGVSEWASRLVPALSALSCVGILLWFGKSIDQPRTGRLAALMFITGLGIVAMARLLMFDMLLTALLSAALCCCYRYLQEGKAALLRWSMAWLALAILAKGLVGVMLFALVILGYLASVHGISARLARAIRRLLRFDAWLILLIIAAPWHIAAALTEPTFAWFYFVNEHFLRFLGRREPHDYYSGPWWYYLPRMMLYLFPWPMLLLICTARVCPIGSTSNVSLRRFLFLAWLLPLLFFSFSRAKANYYLIAVMPFATLHLALGLENYGNAARLSWPGYAMALSSMPVCLVVWFGGERARDAAAIFGLGEKSLAIAILVVLSLLGFCCGWLARHSRLGLAAYLALPAAAGYLIYGLLIDMQSQVSTKELAQWLLRTQSSREVYLYRNFEQFSSLPFYLCKPLPVVDLQSSDLQWGSRLKKSDLVMTNEQFARRLQSGASVALVMTVGQVSDFRKQPFAANMDEAWRSRRLIVFFTPASVAPAVADGHAGMDSQFSLRQKP